MQDDNNKYSEIVIKARGLISDKDKWCQGDYALTNIGKITAADDDDAAFFCAIGALLRFCCSADVSEEPLMDLIGPLAKKQYLLDRNECNPLPDESIGPEIYIAHINDELGHKATLKLYDAVIRSLAENQ